MTAALIGFAILIALSFTGMPLAFATLLTGFVGFGLMRDWDSAVAMSGQQIGEMLVGGQGKGLADGRLADIARMVAGAL